MYIQPQLGTRASTDAREVKCVRMRLDVGEPKIEVEEHLNYRLSIVFDVNKLVFAHLSNFLD